MSRARRIALALITATVAMDLIGVVIVALAGDVLQRPFETDWLNLIAGPAVATFAVFCGGAILRSRPQNLVGWALTVGPALVVFSEVGGIYAGAAHMRSLPMAVPVAILAAAVAPAALASLVVVFATFPNDRPVGALAKATAGAAVIAASVSFANELFLPEVFNLARVGVVNPVGIASLAEVPIYDLAHRTIEASFVVAAAGLVMRAVRSDGEARAQYLWMGWACTIVLVLVGAQLAFGIGDVWVNVGLAVLPAAIAVAITRYRLYDIDRLISRSISYALLTTILALIFATFVVVPQLLIVGTEGSVGGGVIFVAGATLLAAALFNPLRRRVQAGIDRYFDRTRYDARRVVAEFRERLRGPRDIDDLAGDLSEVVTRTLAPSHIGLWAPSGGHSE